MDEGADRVYILDPVDLSRQVYVDNSDYQLLCCGPSGGGSFGGGARRTTISSRTAAPFDTCRVREIFPRRSAGRGTECRPDT
jgi:hypothetical protein